MSLLPILAAKLDYIFLTAMGCLGLLSNCASVVLWLFIQMCMWHFMWHEIQEEATPSICS